MTNWVAYVRAYHEERPGISEDLLATAVDADGRSPYDWLVEAVPPRSTVLDLACGSGPVLRRLTQGARIGIDRAAAELQAARRRDPAAALARADALSLPLRSASVEVVAASLSLMLMAPLGAAVAEIVRVLRAGGTLVATVPVRGETSAISEVLAGLGQRAVAYPDPVSAEALARHGLVMRDDARRTFVRTVCEPDESELIARAFYAPGATDEEIGVAARRLRTRTQSGPVELPFTIRRLVASTST